VDRKRLTAFSSGRIKRRDDLLAVEEPLEIRVGGRSLTVLMRTPGDDIDLAKGLLFTEGIVRRASDIGVIVHCDDPRETDLGNIVTVRLVPGVTVDWKRLKRSFFATASCGLCGKTTIAAVRNAAPPLRKTRFTVRPNILLGLPDRLHEAQAGFRTTGGLHAAGLFDAAGRLLIHREDVGRHNAVDKVIGAALDEGLLPLSRHILLVSGRASFEIIQKALMARVSVVAAVSAPSTLAVELAREARMTLVGFLRRKKFNIYAGEARIARAATGGRACPL